MATTEPKKVKIKLPLTRTEKDDVFVGINGKTYLIKRGETVEVPESVAWVLDRKERMLAKAMEFEAEAAKNVD
jgi:deoxycytidine triphosphate deaminase